MAESFEIQRSHLPEMYRKASDESKRSQEWFIRWNSINLIILVLAAITSTFRDPKPLLPIVGAVLFGLGAVTTFWLRKSGLERRWYSSRAIAESVKTLSWRFMMCATPYEKGGRLSEPEVLALLDKALLDIATQEDAAVPKQDEITDKMKQVRGRAVEARAELYFKERLQQQIDWYTKSNAANEKNGRRVLYLAVFFQLVACVFAIVLVVQDLPDFASIFATGSASFLAWMQLKKYEDVSQAYRTAAKELSYIRGSMPMSSIRSDGDLSKLVLDAENGISREHTLWLAKRQ